MSRYGGNKGDIKRSAKKDYLMAEITRIST